MSNTNGESDEPTIPCRICGRKFIKTSLEKHEPTCKKLTKMQRKVFDSGKQRASGSDIPLRDVRKAAKDREKVGGVFPRPQTHWKERHEDFIGALSASKQVGKALKSGEPLPPPPRTAGSTSSGYILCDFCGRTFSKNAAQRHIAFCKEKDAQKAIKERSTSKRGGRRESGGTSHANRTIGGGPKAMELASKSRDRPESVGPRRMSGGGGGTNAAGGMSGKEIGEKRTTMAQNMANKRCTSVPRNNGQMMANGGENVKSNFSKSAMEKNVEKRNSAKMAPKQKKG